MYDRAMSDLARHHLVGSVQQQTHVLDMNMSFDPAEVNMSPSDSPGTVGFMDDSTLLNLLPVDDHEVIGPPVSGGHRKSQHDHGDHDDHKDLEEDDEVSKMVRTRGQTMGNEGPSMSNHSMHSGTAKTHHTSSGHSGNEEAKDEEEGNMLSMAGIMPPMPPALQLQSSVDSVLMGAVNAGLGNQSPGGALQGIHVPAASALSQHLYAQNYAAAQVRGVVPAPNPYALPPGYADASALPFRQQMGLRVQPPPTMMSAISSLSVSVPGDGSQGQSRVE